MNNVLYLKGTFNQSSRTQAVGPTNIPANQIVEVSKVRQLLADLQRLRSYWIQRQHIIQGALISVYYIKLAAKSNRVHQLLSESSKSPNLSIVGARFYGDSQKKHIITHRVTLNVLEHSITTLQKCITLLTLPCFSNGSITNAQIDAINNNNLLLPFKQANISKSCFVKAIADCYYVEKFDVLTDTSSFQHRSIITLYNTNVNTKDLLNRIGIPILEDRILNETTILLTPDELSILHQKAPFLISMAVSDLNDITKETFLSQKSSSITIPSPDKEPTIGVIDTLFDKRVYFSEWVEYYDMVNPNISRNPEDFSHGTAVSSIIVDGPAFNPQLNDNCGRFRVRHFGVATGKRFSSFSILRAIQEIVTKNRDIKVWNLSLGSKMEVSPNSISPEAAILDEIQYKNNVIFVVAGTNKTDDEPNVSRLGAPADSINSLVVNSVDFQNHPASYSRQGPVLSFFKKPDISYYGGEGDRLIRVCTPTGESVVCGTSFAAPWIARKLCYLIDVVGLNRELAKALLIHSATNWDAQPMDISNFIGYGIVPIDINQIIHSSDDEIRFMLAGNSKKYNTYTYNIPVPSYQGKHPFITKATLCYFPSCSRNQGVDYTNTELDIQFGRIDGGIKPIDNNYQTVPGHHVLEADARKYFRKWNNIKHIREIATGRNQGKKAYQTGLWGLSLKRNERLDNGYEWDLHFGIIISLKHIKGENKIEDFIQNCQLKGWLVNHIDVNNQVEIYNRAEQEVVFDD
ncbi:S8 family peptidase [Candidatus Avelusimicrobium luingense]|uniref:S8 family peptidase n=1 Tax=Candidatus Avelusimicrobium luingense TaxID=3416211 RepID=UPI003D146E91